jgi:predicted transcriptional regulator
MSRLPIIQKSELQNILKLLNEGVSQGEIANRLGVSQPAVSYFLKVNKVKNKWGVEE